MEENLTYLPERLPVPIADGACKHLIGLPIPNVKLKATNGNYVFFENANREIGVLFISHDRPFRNPVAKRLG